MSELRRLLDDTDDLGSFAVFRTGLDDEPSDESFGARGSVVLGGAAGAAGLAAIASGSAGNRRPRREPRSVSPSRSGSGVGCWRGASS
ncbi:MAG: hypothetical protein U0263_13440 [Polyangiaceae bacterium]